MKRTLMACTAIVIIAAPVFAPLTAVAQDEQASAPRHRERERPSGRGDNGETPARAERPQQRPSRPQGGSSSQNRPDSNGGGRGSDRPQRPDRGDRPDRPQGSQRPDDRPNNGGGQSRPDRPNGGQRPDGRPDNNGGWNQNRPDRPNGSQRPDRPNGGHRPDNGRPDHGRPNQGRPNNDRPNNGGWNQGGRDRHQDFNRRFDQNQWRRDWNRNHRNDWWRNDRRFRGYSGVRVGFYFAPGWGYYSVPRTYWNRTWRQGEYLPDVFWRYRLDDWRTYGLGYPPAGTRWVYVDNSIYLIDEYDGYIIEVIYDAWRW